MAIREGIQCLRNFTTSCLDDALSLFRFYQRLGEAAIAQVADEELTRVLDPEMNSITQTVKHVVGDPQSFAVDPTFPPASTLVATNASSSGEKATRYM
ncbi:MAG: DUF1572 domain-containing protein [Gemmatimonas sp.]|nr:DUF1572 domain-containing protein [Gemmatimonas sp.]